MAAKFLIDAVGEVAKSLPFGEDRNRVEAMIHDYRGFQEAAEYLRARDLERAMPAFDIVARVRRLICEAESAGDDAVTLVQLKEAVSGG
ncbi:hypothetical protein HOT31_gp007 [Microbacterium phage Hendrix]|uniref:Uncharacterized protein n=1 Tax=Microbacterium phage Hendrix TaxID=2182341 RepID=A0A2U8UU53_9CAUD|nr:hypothetical protein HOT31_gp007 [Microbacterium phage Hendrix]AWN07678.1 hypothetical protein PBI_HENDRIX_7 [Microbacterium phage Hendrix]